MSKKWLVLPIILGLALTGCKSKQEAMADDFLAEGKLGNAIQLYTKAEQKGDVSEEFNDNFSLAYLRQASKLVKRDPMNGLVASYLEQVAKMMAKSTNATVQEEYVNTLAEIGTAQAGVEANYEFTLQGFNNLKIAEEYSKAHGGVASAKITEAKKAAEAKAVKNALEAAASASNGVAAEYELLAGEVVAPTNAEIQSALNAVRLKNRGDYLNFEAAGVEAPSRWVNKYGYVMAFPSISVSPSALKGEMVLWNSSGNNTDLVAADVRLISEDGKEVKNQSSSGHCTGNDPIKPQNNPFVGGKGKCLSEGTCNIQVSFTYGSDFVPAYIEYKDQFGTGRKYLGK